MNTRLLRSLSTVQAAKNLCGFNASCNPPGQPRTRLNRGPTCPSTRKPASGGSAVCMDVPMSKQLDLFDHPQPAPIVPVQAKALARSTDPQTSKAAARELVDSGRLS